LIGEIKEPEIRLVATRAYMRYLATSPMQKESFIEWFYQARWGVEKYPDLFKELAEEFPNPNLKVMVSARKTLAAEKEKSPAVGLTK
jgi:hypothetical protein